MLFLFFSNTPKGCPWIHSAYTVKIFEAHKLTCVLSQEDVVSERTGRSAPSSFILSDLFLYTWISGHRFSFCSSAAFSHVSTSDHLYIHTTYSLSFTQDFHHWKASLCRQGRMYWNQPAPLTLFETYRSFFLFLKSNCLNFCSQKVSVCAWKQNICAHRKYENTIQRWIFPFCSE